MIQTGLVSVSFRKLSPAEVIDLAQQNGLSSIEWGGDVHLPHGDAARAREVKRRTLDAGLAVSAYGSYYRLRPDLAESPDFSDVLKSAVALEAPIIRVWPGTLGSATVTSEEWTELIRESQRIADMARGEGIDIAFEFHRNTLTDTNESTARLLVEVDRANVSTFWQPHFFMESHAERLSGLQTLLPQVTNIHVYFWDADHAERYPLAGGEEIWLDYLQLAARDQEMHVASLEFVANNDPANLVADASTLRKWVSQLAQGAG
jgi:sugar phosphate isomerase/epimerase